MTFDLNSVITSTSSASGILGSELIWPLDLTSHKMCLAIMPYIEKIEGKDTANPNKLSTSYPIIYLPLPFDFQETYDHKYTEENLLINLRKGQVGGGSETIKNLVLGGLGTTYSDISVRVAGRLGSGVSPLDSLRSYYRMGDLPSMENLYDSPNVRSWSFSYKLLPNSPREAEILRDLIVYLKWLSAPEYNTIIDSWPHLCNIAFLAIEGDNDQFFQDVRQDSDNYIEDQTRTSQNTIFNRTSTINGGEISIKDKATVNRPQRFQSGINNIFTFTEMGIQSITWRPSPSGRTMTYDNGFPQESDLVLTFLETRPLDKEGIVAEVKNSK